MSELGISVSHLVLLTSFHAFGGASEAGGGFPLGLLHCTGVF